MKLLTDNQADLATVSCDDASVNYPASNVQDSRLSRIFRGDESIEFDITGSGGLKNISQAYTNIVQDPTDLTTANWTNANGCTSELSILSINGNLYTKLGSTTGTSDPQITQTISVTASSKHNCSLILKNGNLTADSGDNIVVYSLLSGEVNQLTVNFGQKVVLLNLGDSLDYEWIDDDTVYINLTTVGGSVGTTLTFRIDPNNIGDTTKYFYVTEAQVIDNTTTMFPFVDGTHSADVITETFTMPDRFTFDMIIEPKFAYDTSISHRFAVWGLDADSYFKSIYYASADQILISWKDNTGEKLLSSQTFDDGTSHTNINQRIRIVGSVDLTTGNTTGSRHIVLALDDDTLNEDTLWNGDTDVKSSVFPTLRIGNDGGANQADSEYEYLRIYEGLLVGTVTSSDDVTELLKDKKILLDKTYQQKLTATDLLIAGSTINDGDSITLVGNDLDSYGVGSPVYEDVTWSKDIITHTFTKASHQYWRLIVNSSNTIDIGRLYLGSSFTTASISPVVGHSRVSNSIKSISVSGNSYMDTRYFSSTISIKWSAITTVEKEDLIEQFEAVDIGKPFFIIFDESNISLGTVYCTIDQEGFNFNLLANPEYWEAALSLQEEV